ncbi:toprim domain-containing protein [Fibrella sp. WM1]|uniref:toprim domain-containing protein n=1 Tax=Fibrella musci TaxID=3242485 RepID=UPI0035213332
MNIDQAKHIGLAELLTRLDIHPRQTQASRLLYLSPVRVEKTPSFYVYLKTNTWHDFGDGRGGDAVDLACAWLKFYKHDCTPADGLRWLRNMQVGFVPYYPLPALAASRDEPGLTLVKRQPLQHLALRHYLDKRGIPFPIARAHLQELRVRNPHTDKGFFALGFANEEGGHELRNPFFKGTLGAKALSIVRGTDPLSRRFHVFEGMMDYLSALTQARCPALKGDSYVLHSVTNLKQLYPYIHGYGYRVGYSWLDNDGAGQQATAALQAFCQTQADLVHKPMNQVYAPHKDLNAWHMHVLGLSL